MKSSWTFLLALAAFGHAALASPEAFTVSAAIETARFMASAPTFSTLTPNGEFRNSGSSEIFVSPDNRLWAALLIKGDLQRNGNWAEILLGSLTSLDAAARPRVLARFFTQSLGDGTQGGGGPVQLTLSGSNPRPLQWLSDNRRLALLWTDEAERKQIFVVEASTGRIQQLTKHATPIRAFANHGDTFLYIAEYRATESSAALSKRDRKKGVTIETRSLPAVLRGELDGDFEGSYFKWFVLDARTGESREITGLGPSRFDWTGATFSHDGRFAIVESAPESVPESWGRFTEQFWSRMIRLARSNPNDLLGRQLMQLYVVDVSGGTAWPLWDAPGKAGAKIAWSPDGDAVVLSPTFVPVPGASTAGLAGDAAAVVDIRSGSFRAIPVSACAALAAASIRWVDPTTIECQDGNEFYQYRETRGEWRRVQVRSRGSGRAVIGQAALDVRVEEDMNTPPTLVATDRRSGRTRQIYDPNPQLKHRFTLGRVAMTDWRDPDGRTWAGRLYYPVHWQPGQRYPLVIQTMDFAPEHVFSLYGGADGDPALGPGVTVSAAQPLANRGIMVLSVERKFLPEIDNTPGDAEVHAAAYEAAIEHLDRMGIIDRQRVGISGYSNTGYLVQYALVHSGFPYAAAITDDNFDGSYYQAVTTGSEQYANTNGAEPYAEGLKVWLQRAPAFNADRIRTPLRLQRTSPPPVSILGSWEMFTRLRQLNKPVEFFLIPDIEHGSHVIQNPLQCLASQEGAVDWFDFWLNEREDPDPGKAEQYARWRNLRASNKPVALSERSYGLY